MHSTNSIFTYVWWTKAEAIITATAQTHSHTLTHACMSTHIVNFRKWTNLFKKKTNKIQTKIEAKPTFLKMATGNRSFASEMIVQTHQNADQIEVNHSSSSTDYNSFALPCGWCEKVKSKMMFVQNNKISFNKPKLCIAVKEAN